MDTDCSAAKVIDFGYYEEYLRSISNKKNVMEVLRKAHSHSVMV